MVVVKDEKPDPQLVCAGRRFGNLEVLYDEIPDVNQTMSISIMRAACKCDCGTIVRIYLNNLVSGTISSCGCQDEYLIPDEYRERCEQLAKQFNINIGVALSYIERNMTDDEILEDGKLFQTYSENELFKRNSDKGDSNIVGHMRFVGGDNINGFIGVREVVYKKYLCRCGRTMYLQKKLTHRGMSPWPCICDVIHEKFYGRSHPKVNIMDITYGKQPVKRAVFDKKKCLGLGTYDGICIHYNGDRGCLDQLAHNRFPTRYKDGYTCYKSSLDDRDENLDSRFSGIYQMLQL